MNMIGPIVRRIRQERGLSQETLALSAHVSSGYLSKLERGLYKQPSFEVLSRIAGALSIPTADLYRAAGIEHLLGEDSPSLEPIRDTLTLRLDDLPKTDREIIESELRRIILEENEAKP